MLTITGHYDPHSNNLTIRTSDNSVLAHCDYPPTHSTLKRDDYHVGEEWLHYNPAHNVHHFFIAAAAKLTAALAKQDENLIVSTGELTIREPQYRLEATRGGVILVNLRDNTKHTITAQFEDDDTIVVDVFGTEYTRVPDMDDDGILTVAAANTVAQWIIDHEDPDTLLEVSYPLIYGEVYEENMGESDPITHTAESFINQHYEYGILDYIDDEEDY